MKLSRVNTLANDILQQRTDFSGPQANSFLAKPYVSGKYEYTSETLAKNACLDMASCTGVTQGIIYRLRYGQRAGTIVYTYETLAKNACEANSYCTGITQESVYTLRTGKAMNSNSGEVSWFKSYHHFEWCDMLLQQFHRNDEELSVNGKWQGGSVTGVCRGWGTSKVG